MPYIDVFNGDADGLCALQQLRLADPVPSTLVTGVKRDIELVARAPAGGGDVVTVLDLSFDRNRAAVLDLLERGARVRYFDHHFAGDVPAHPRLEAHIDTSPRTCTSMVVDRFLGGRFRPWAVVAGFGDNLGAEATRLAAPLGYSPAQLAVLRELGEAMNYNAYGETESDLFVAPAALYRAMSPHEDPLRFIALEPIFALLRDGRREDLARALTVAAARTSWSTAAYVLPDAPWARRVIGSFANYLATTYPERAHAVLAPNPRGGYVVSLRAPLDRPTGADALCRAFPTGGGRPAAAGIDTLPDAELESFLARFDGAF